MRSRVVWSVIASFLLVVLVSACGSQAGPAPTAPAGTETPDSTASPTASMAASGDLIPVTAMLDWVPNTNHTGLYVALDKGWYKEQGLDVKVVEPAESGVEQVVASGQAQFGVSYQEGVTNARAQDVPIVSIAAVIQHNTSGFASPKDKNITRPKDFEGKKYGAFGSPTEHQVLQALMEADGGDVSKVQFVDIGSTDFFVATQRDVDFAWIFQGWTGIEAQMRGVPLNYIAMKDWTEAVPDYYTPVLITSEKLVQENPDLARKFMAATSKGYQFAIDNPKEAADILIKYTPETNPDLIRQSQAFLSPLYKDDASRWGEQKLEVWKGYGDWMADRKLLPKRIDAAKAFTNDFLPK